MIRVDESRCTGCSRCAVQCAFFHSGRVHPGLARVKVLHLYESGIDGPVVCVQCHERYCLSCPDKALTIGPDGQVYVSPTRCNLCGACERSCPIGAIEIFRDIVHVCDLCGGRPRCVEACTEGAVTWDRGGGGTMSLADFRPGAARLSPARKRLAYVKKRTEALRRAWEKARA